MFVGCSASETAGALTQDPETVTGYTLTGCVRSMFSNRISYTFDLQGPSFSVDTACSSSLLALQLAIDSIRQVGAMEIGKLVRMIKTDTLLKSCEQMRTYLLSGSVRRCNCCWSTSHLDTDCSSSILEIGHAHR